MINVQSPVLVVELTLNRLEGTQLRALGLLSVFGFNMTYMVKGPTDEPGPKSCSTIECRLLGHCYAKHDYKEFYCNCFEGYSGAVCGVGPLCPKTPNMCKNGGTSGQMGPAAVSCICAPGFTGDLCEAQIEAPKCGIEECAEGCKAGACDCSPKNSDVSSARFDTRLQIMDERNINISQEIIKQISNYLRACNITLQDEIEILNISAPEETGARTVWLRVWAERRDAGALRTALARLVAMRTRTDRLHLLPSTLHFDMQPALNLHALTVDQRQEVWEGSEFILSCMAYGSPDITFTWFKDSVKVNFKGTTRDIWTCTVAEDALGRRMSVLGISEAKKPDSGRWSCSADDAGRRRCSALRLTILRPPDIRLVPSTVTVNKGDNVSITCLASAGRMHGVLGFSWARERSLLPQVPGLAVWEDLYPAGSVLKLYNVQKSGEYRCQVSSVTGTNTKGVTMWALGPKDEACESGTSHGLRWPKTSPGTHASANCPPGHNGESVRFCEPKSIQHAVKWMVPDFSRCIANSLNDIYEQFTKISYGYSWGNVSDVTQQYGAVLRLLPAQPGERTLPLKHARTMLHYLLSNAAKPSDRRESVKHLLIIYDTLLKHPDTFLDEEKIYELQNVLIDTATLHENLDNLYQEFSVKTKQVRKDGVAHFSFISNRRPEEWLLTSAGVELVDTNGSMSVVVVQYRDLTARLPSLRRSIEVNTATEEKVEEFYAQLEACINNIPKREILMVISDFNAKVGSTVQDTGLRNIMGQYGLGCRNDRENRLIQFAGDNDFTIMNTTFRHHHRRLYTWTSPNEEYRNQIDYILIRTRRRSISVMSNHQLLVCNMRIKLRMSIERKTAKRVKVLDQESFVRSLQDKEQYWRENSGEERNIDSLWKTTVKLIKDSVHESQPNLRSKKRQHWMKTETWALIEKRRDLKASEGKVQQLNHLSSAIQAPCRRVLLQAELAGRRLSFSSVTLLAGVCTLLFLTARMSGGAPLQFGTAAQALCAAGCAMLAVLCFTLAVCAALRLRSMTHKIPCERRTYLKDRRHVVRHTLAVLATTGAVQAAGVLWAQPGPRTLVHVLALSIAALVNGITMLVCCVIRDEECLQSARQVLSLPSRRDWQEPQLETHPLVNKALRIPVYIKQGGEVESRGSVGMLKSTSSQVSPVTSYWRAPGLESPSRIYRRQSTPDTRADIDRCVECKHSLLSQQRYDANVGGQHLGDSPMGPTHIVTKHAVCDLIPHSQQRPEYMAHVCLELGVLRTLPKPATSLLTCSVDFKPYTGRYFDTSKDGCSICAHSNPDVSKITSPPIKSCLKKPESYVSSSISLPSIELKQELKSKSDIEQINREWSKAYEAPEADRMLNKISNDLDFLLNRTQDKNIVLDQIEKAPT